MAINASALTSVQRVADYLDLGTLVSGTATHTLVERLVNDVSSYVQRYLGYALKKAAVTNEEYDTERSDILVLERFPILSAETFTLQRRNTSLNEDEWETVESKYYSVDHDAGIVYMVGNGTFARTRRGYRASYTAGYDFNNTSTYLSDTEAGDLEMAVWDLIKTGYDRRSGGSSGISSESIGDYRVVYARVTMENETIKGILDSYRRAEVVGPLTPFQS